MEIHYIGKLNSYRVYKTILMINGLRNMILVNYLYMFDFKLFRVLYIIR